MPCRTDDFDSTSINRDRLGRLEDYEAAFCAVMTVLEGEDENLPILKKIDWKEAGLTKRKFLERWEEHKEKDAKRRAREELERAREAAKTAALNKLTITERVLLGLEK